MTVNVIFVHSVRGAEIVLRFMGGLNESVACMVQGVQGDF